MFLWQSVVAIPDPLSPVPVANSIGMWGEVLYVSSTGNCAEPANGNAEWACIVTKINGHSEIARIGTRSLVSDPACKASRLQLRLNWCSFLS